MATRKTINFLPEIFKSEINQKFLGATFDQLISEPELLKINGFVGRKFSPVFRPSSNYLLENNNDRQNYQLEPAVVIKGSNNNLELYSDYKDLVSKIEYHGGIVNNHHRLFESDYYRFDPRIDFDKFVNFSKYYWMPIGPQTVAISSGANDQDTVYTFTRTPNGYRTSQTGLRLNPTITLLRGVTYSFEVDQVGHKLWIQTEPGNSGRKEFNNFVSSRNIYGVQDNGIDQGSITFTVPAKDSQDYLLTMPKIDYVSYGVEDPFSAIDGLEWDQGSSNIDGDTDFPVGRYLIFLHSNNTNGYWTDFVGNIIPTSQRKGLWRIEFDYSTERLRLVYVRDLPTMTRISFNAGDDEHKGSEYYKDNNNSWIKVPDTTAPLSTLYFQDENNPNFFGTIKIVDNPGFQIDVEQDILNKQNYTSSNGIKLTNGLKISFDDSVIPEKYRNKIYIVEGVGKSIKLVDFDQLDAIESLSPELTIPWDTYNFDIDNFDEPIKGSVELEYIVMNRSCRDGNAWARANRWFHEDTIKQAAEYNGITFNVPQEFRAKRPIIEFEEDLQLYNFGRIFLGIVDRVDDQKRDQNGNNIFITNAFEQFNGWPVTDPSINHLRIIENQTVVFVEDLDVAVRSNLYRIQFQDLSTGPAVADAVPGTGVISASVNSTRVLDASDKNEFPKTKFRTEIVIGTTLYTDNGIYIGKVKTIQNNNEIILEHPPAANYNKINFKYNVPRIQLVLVTTAQAFDTIAVRSATNAGKSYWFNGTDWSIGQTKTAKNQQIEFDVINDVDISFGDRIFYPQNNFKGTKVFSYQIGTGSLDTVLNFSLTYSGLGTSLADISFVNYFDTDQFTFKPEAEVTKKISTGYLRKNIDRFYYKKLNVWSKVKEPSKQYQHISHNYDGITSYFEIDILPGTNQFEPNLKVFVNNQLIKPVDYTIQTVGARKAIKINSPLVKGDFVDILIFSSSTSSLGYYQIPKNLEFNSQNISLSSITLGQVRSHWAEIGRNTLNLVGDPVSNNNLRDLDTSSQAGVVLQHSAPTIYSSLFLIDPVVNFIHGIELAKRDYTKFKNKFLELCLTLPGLNFRDPVTGVEQILKSINEVKNGTFPWYYSDMIPWNADFVSDSYRIINVQTKNYAIGNVFTALGNKIYPNQGIHNSAVLVYLNNRLLTIGKDYNLYFGTPEVVLSGNVTLNLDDRLVVKGYVSTDGSYVPETPTKLGLYKKFMPEKFLDNTYRDPIEVIQGHDGSIIPAFGDHRDDFLLELEKRIYNNIKVEYRSDIFDIYSIIPGKFRKTDYSLKEFNQVLSTEFLKWVGTNQLDFSTNEIFKSNEKFTWNYNQTTDVVNGEKLPGYWRGVYKYFYDTDRPHTHPWEMLGYTIKPDWWDIEYGVAPYKSDNTKLWTDLSTGFDRGSGKAISKFARPQLLSIIPVDISGNLLAPQEKLVKDFDGTNFSQSFAVGDHGPVESAWRRSSEFLFALQKALALLKPARYFSLQFDTNLFYKDQVLDQISIKETNQRITPSIININGETVNGQITRVTGYINWIHGYLTGLGIDAAEKIRYKLSALDVKLGYKVAGFTDKNYLTVLAEQFSPTSVNESVIIPNENYLVHLNKSVPVRRAVYSAIIVEKTTTGYSVKGYNLKFPYFTIIPSEPSNNSYTIEALSARAVIFKDFKNQKINVPYGFEFKNVQQVVDFLVSYERYLISQGFIFNKYDSDLDTLRDWVLSSREFLTWSQQGWRPGSLLVLSPVSNYLNIIGIDATVDTITNQINDSQILGPNYNVIRLNELSVMRDNTTTTITSISGQTIAFADLNMVQFEHALVFDNVTVFNDIVYKPELGSRQYRLKLVGNKTGSWTGALNPPGFVYNNGIIDEWKPETDYKKGDIVKFKNQNYTAISNIAGSTIFDFDEWSILDTQIEAGLVPNFATNANKFIDIYDVDSESVDEEFDMFSNGLIGYRNRPYLSDLGMDINSQSKFYQGFIKQKGTKKSIQSLFSGEFETINNEVSIYEEWGLRVGEYGSLQSDYNIELLLDEQKFKGNPIVFKLLNSSEINREPVLTVRPKELLNRPLNYISPIFLNRPLNLAYETDIKVSGYVNINDIDSQLYDFNNYSSLTTSILSDITDGYLLWVAKDFNDDWQVYKIIEQNNSIIEIDYVLDNRVKVITQYDHGLQIGDIFAIRGFRDFFDGFYQVVNVETGNSLIILVDDQVLSNIIERQYNGIGSLFVLQKSRYKTTEERDADVTRTVRETGDLVWVDNFPDNVWTKHSFVRGNPGTFSSTKTFWGIENGTITLRASGLPYHSYGNITQTTTGIEKNYNRSWPLYAGSPSVPTIQRINPDPVPIGTEIIGFTLSGVPIYSPDGGEFTAPGDYVAIPGFNYNLAFSNYNVFNIDDAGGTTANDGTYFYRSFSFAEAWETGLGRGEATSNVGIPETASFSYLNGGLLHSDGHSKIIGFSFDGYPIYGPFGYSNPLDNQSNVVRMESGYGLKNSSYRANTEACNLSVHPMGMFIQDYIFNGQGSLDIHNGRYCVTPDYPDGTYAYFATVDVLGKPVYPYFVGPTYYGNVFSVGNPLIVGTGKEPFAFRTYVNVSWETLETKQPKVDIRSIGGMYLFDNTNKQKLTDIDFIDPVKGRVLGTAAASIDFMTEFDPAKYNVGTIEELPINEDFHWGEKQIGMIWWDLDSARYYDYEQNSLEYRVSNWGKLFPGSSIQVYEWVESAVLPSEYSSTNEGEPKYADDSAYVVLTSVDQNTGVTRSKYYFWVRGRTTSIASKMHSALSIEKMIEDPVLENIPYAAILRNNSIALFNVGKFLSGNNVALHINYKTSLNENIIHSEYEIFQEGNEYDVMNTRIENKLIDSLVGADEDNQLVPDPSLLPGDKIGLSVRPRQTLILKRLKALENSFTYVNSVLIKYPISTRIINKDVIFSDNFYAEEKIPDDTAYDFVVDSFNQLDYVPELQAGFFVPGKTYLITEAGTTDFTLIGAPNNNRGTRFIATGIGTGDGYAFPSRILVRKDANYNNRWTIYEKNVSGVISSLLKIQTYNSTNFWFTVDWYADGYSQKTMVLNHIVETYNDIFSIDGLEKNHLVKIKNNGANLFEIYKVGENNKFELIALEKGTIQLSSALWKPIGFDHFNFDSDPFDYNYFTELRKIIMGLKFDIFVRDLKRYWNKFLFYIVEYILSEQKYVDWIFKTSFVSIIHRFEGLIQSPTYIKDKQKYYEQYIREVKPYRTKLREYSMNYSGMDIMDTAAFSDFDLPAYYDTSLRKFIVPNGLYPEKDTAALNNRPEFQDWKNNYKYQIGNFEIANSGRGYKGTPDIIIRSKDTTGQDAKASALVAGTNGAITKVYVNDPGKDYTLTPEVTVLGTGTTNTSVIENPLWKPAKLVPRLVNNKIRKVKTIIKFDRVGSTIPGSLFANYGSNVVDWQPDIAYPQGSYVSYNNQGYRSIRNVPPLSYFDNSGFELVESRDFDNANDRIIAYYAPSSDMVPKVLSRLMTGLDNQAVEGDNQVVIDTAIQGGSFTGNSIRAGNFVVGEKYIITSLGTNGNLTDFKLIGAYDNQIGLLFTATNTGAANGTGTATIAIFTGNVGGVTGTAPEDINLEGGAFVYETFSHAPEELLPSRVYDAISIVVRNENPASDSGDEYEYLGGFRIFINMNNETEETRISQATKTTLTVPLALTDNTITVANGSILANPDPFNLLPGIIYINGERIEYYSKTGNVLSQIKRGVGGTSISSLHKVSSVVENANNPVVLTIPPGKL